MTANVTNLTVIALIPLRDAYLCANCEVIGNDARKCWSCGEESGLLPLAKTLGLLKETECDATFPQKVSVEVKK